MKKKRKAELLEFASSKVFGLPEEASGEGFVIDGNKIFDMKDKDYSLVIKEGSNKFQLFDYDSENFVEVKKKGKQVTASEMGIIFNG